MADHIWDIGEIPFYTGARPTPSNKPLPDMLPMQVAVDSVTDALVQVMDPAVKSALEDAYVRGSQIGTPLSAAGAGQPALEDFLAFVHKMHGGLAGANVLEIGCGGGPLLQRISTEGAETVGVEPDVGPARQAETAGLNVIASTFDPGLFPNKRFDVIVHHAVLEHVEA